MAKDIEPVKDTAPAAPDAASVLADLVAELNSANTPDPVPEPEPAYLKPGTFKKPGSDWDVKYARVMEPIRYPIVFLHLVTRALLWATYKKERALVLLGTIALMYVLYSYR